MDKSGGIPGFEEGHSSVMGPPPPYEGALHPPAYESITVINVDPPQPEQPAVSVAILQPTPETQPPKPKPKPKTQQARPNCKITTLINIVNKVIHVYTLYGWLPSKKCSCLYRGDSRY